jgi:alcohol dehydrogenase class IV
MQERSEVALLKARIAAEAQAAYQGMHGLANGVLRHRFIAAHMQRMERRYDQLEQLVGSNGATHYLIEVMDQNMPQISSQPLFEETQKPD